VAFVDDDDGGAGAQLQHDQPRRSMTVALACPPPSHIVWKP
jgi:hypothetical protein